MADDQTGLDTHEKALRRGSLLEQLRCCALTSLCCYPLPPILPLSSPPPITQHTHHAHYQVSKTLAVFDSLLSLHSQVSSSSAAMSSNTEALLAQKATLTEFAEALRARLKFFDEYELAANQFASAAAAPDSADLMPLLHKLDECIGYVAANPQYADAVTYANKFRQLQLKALGLVRGRVQSVLRAAAQSVQAAVIEAAAAGAGGGGATSSTSSRAPVRTGSGLLRGGSGVGCAGVGVLPEGQEVSLLYVRFRAAAEPALKGKRRV